MASRDRPLTAPTAESKTLKTDLKLDLKTDLMIRRLAVLGIVLLLLAAGAAWWLQARLSTPYRGFTATEVFVELPPGSSVSGIADRLAANGVVIDPLSFKLAARVARVERRLQAGEYRFADAATPLEIVKRIADGDVFVRPLTFPEGRTIREMAEIFEESGLGTAEQFRAAAADTTLVAELDPGARSLEGYLFPDTYALPRNAGAERAVRAMVDRFAQTLDEPLRAAIAASGMTLREVVTLASIVEKETGAAAERPTVAAVYRNRLRIGMPLQCDPTVIYALMRAGRWTGNLTRNDLQMDSPYNTYRHAGLPPGPIASPGRASIEAVVNPADVPYLYFVSRNDGTHVFASTLSEHNRNVQEWQVNYFRKAR